MLHMSVPIADIACKVRSRRKQRRWDNDHFFGIGEVVGGATRQGVFCDEGDDEEVGCTLCPEWSSSLGSLVTEHDVSSELREVDSTSIFNQPPISLPFP
ncbi:unnamed protein product [Chrysoparadoxa australica]